MEQKARDITKPEREKEAFHIAMDFLWGRR
jgi:hypothetical protein